MSGIRLKESGAYIRKLKKKIGIGYKRRLGEGARGCAVNLTPQEYLFGVVRANPRTGQHLRKEEQTWVIEGEPREGGRGGEKPTKTKEKKRERKEREGKVSKKQ